MTQSKVAKMTTGIIKMYPAMQSTQRIVLKLQSRVCWYSGVTCDQLRALLRAKGKPTGGIKADFIKRLEDEDESDGDATTSS